ncbi:MAG: type II secretion system GspH family protein [Eubacteriales bacterium]|nr:type II secretion system GspH family protein [Eubacteriales bacterium]
MKNIIFKNLKNKKGFTLIEVITVITVLVMIMGIVIPNFTIFMENGKKTQDLTIAKVIFASAESAMNDILMGKHKVEFEATKNDKIENGFDNSSNYKFYNGSFEISEEIKTPIKLIISKGGYINGLPREKWTNEFRKYFDNETEIVYDYANKTIKSVSYKGVIYQK